VTEHDVPTLYEARASFERRFVSGALARAGGRRGQAALDFGITRQGLAKLLKRLQLDASAASTIRTSRSQ
jgi:DNA-binding NtrC family response regulator